LLEAVAALVVLALATSQISEIMSQFVRASRETKLAVASARNVLTDLGKVSSAATIAPLPAAGLQRRVTIGDQIFNFDVGSRSSRKPCLFDATGRRCR